MLLNIVADKNKTNIGIVKVHWRYVKVLFTQLCLLLNRELFGLNQKLFLKWTFEYLDTCLGSGNLYGSNLISYSLNKGSLKGYLFQ